MMRTAAKGAVPAARGGARPGLEFASRRRALHALSVSRVSARQPAIGWRTATVMAFRAIVSADPGLCARLPAAIAGFALVANGNDPDQVFRWRVFVERNVA